MSKFLAVIVLVVLIGCCGYFCITQATLAGELKQRGLEHTTEISWAVGSFILGVIITGVLYWLEEEY